MFTADELNGTDLHQVDPVTRRVIGHARQRHEVDWLRGRSACVQFANSRTAIQFSSVQFFCCEHFLTRNWVQKQRGLLGAGHSACCGCVPDILIRGGGEPRGQLIPSVNDTIRYEMLF